MDAAALKTKEHETWTRVTPGWRKHDPALTAWLAPVTAKLLESAGVSAGMSVLDLACGTGEPAIPAAKRIGAAGRVLAVDFVEDMLVFAREKAVKHGLKNVEFRRQDGETLDAPASSFDAVTMRFGLMFMPEPAKCLERAYAALKPGGRLALSTWAAPDKNPWAAVALGVLKRHLEVPAPPPGAPGLFALADPGRLRALLTEARLRDAAVEPVPVSLRFASGKDYFEFIIELAGPLAALYTKLPEGAKPKVAAEIAAEAEKSRIDGRVTLGGVAWVAGAVK